MPTITADVGEVVTLGPYYVHGTPPPPLRFQFTDNDGNAIDISSGFNITYSWRRSRTTTQVDRSGSVDDGENGWGLYTWVAGDIATPGVYYGQMWADNGTNGYPSAMFVYEVRAFP